MRPTESSKQPAPTRFESLKRAAERREVGVATLEHLIESGHLTSFRIGRRIRRVDSGAVDRALDRLSPRPD